MHNRYLPTWLHRICNAVLGVMLVATLGLSAVTKLLPIEAQHLGVSVVIVSALMTVVVLLVVSPEQISIVEGIAGNIGYDELTDEESVDSTGDIMARGQGVARTESRH